MLMYRLERLLYIVIILNYILNFPPFFQAHGRPSLRNLVQEWNKTLQQDLEHKLPTKMDAAAAFLASLEESKITSLQDSAKKPPIEILPPGMASLYGPNPGAKKPGLALHTSQQQVGNQLLLEGPNKTPQNASTSSEPPPSKESDLPHNTNMEDASNTSDSLADSSVGAPTSELPELPDSANTKSDVPPQSEPDASVPPVTELGDPNASQLDDKTMGNQDQISSTIGVPEPTETEASVSEPTETEPSVPPSSTDIPVVTNAGPQESKD